MESQYPRPTDADFETVHIALSKIGPKPIAQILAFQEQARQARAALLEPSREFAKAISVLSAAQIAALLALPDVKSILGKFASLPPVIGWANPLPITFSPRLDQVTQQQDAEIERLCKKLNRQQRANSKRDQRIRNLEVQVFELEATKLALSKENCTLRMRLVDLQFDAGFQGYWPLSADDFSPS